MFAIAIDEVVKPSPQSECGEPEEENVEVSVGVSKCWMFPSDSHSKETYNLYEFGTNGMFYTTTNSGGDFPVWVRSVRFAWAQSFGDQVSSDCDKEEAHDTWSECRD